MLAYYWQKGIPSIVLAIVTLVLGGYSYWFVQSNVKKRYEDICSRNFLLLDGKNVDRERLEKSQNKQPWQVETEEPSLTNAAHKRGSDERRRLLEQTELCLRRLIIWDKTDDAVRYKSAEVADLLADWYLDRARELPKEGANDEVASLIARAQSERKKAADAMRTVQKLDGKFAFKAYLWTVRQRLRDTPELTSDELVKTATQISDTVAKDGDGVNEIMEPANAILAQIFALQKLRVSRLSSVDDPLELPPYVLPFFDAAQNSTVESLAWAAEAKSITDVKASEILATRALQTYWGKSENETFSVETLSEVFRCLLLVNSIKEAQVFLSEQLHQVPDFEQSRLRALAAAACLRQIVLNTIADKSDAGSALASQSLFSMSMQLNPESEQILVILEMICDPSKLEKNSIRWKNLLGVDSNSSGGEPAELGLDVGLQSLLNACIGLRQNPISNVCLSNLKTAIKATPVNGIVAARLANQLVATDAIRVDDAIQWLETINDASPDVLIAWSERAKLHLLKKEYANAAECYEFLLAKVPGNEQLREAIDAAKSQAAVLH